MTPEHKRKLETTLKTWAREILAKGGSRNPERLKALLKAGQQRLLDLEDVRQDYAWDCGHACLEAAGILLGSHGDVKSQVFQALGETQDGVHPEKVLEAAKSLGLEAEGREMTRDELDTMFTAGMPVICPIQKSDDGGSHYVVVIGTAPRSVYVHDPLAGRKRIGNELWEKRWHVIASDGSEYQRWGIILSAKK
jgi:predicted double-glycine peptidase